MGGPWMKMYFLLKIGDFPASYVTLPEVLLYQRVTVNSLKKNHPKGIQGGRVPTAHCTSPNATFQTTGNSP